MEHAVMSAGGGAGRVSFSHSCPCGRPSRADVSFASRPRSADGFGGAPFMGNGPKLLDDLLAPLGLGRFVSDVWTKSHCLLKGEKGRFTPLHPWEALNDILQWHRPSPGQLKLFQDGRQIDPARFIDNPSAEPRLNSGGLISALSQGASLVMDDVQSLVPAVARLAGALQDAFHAPAIVNLYAGWGGRKVSTCIGTRKRCSSSSFRGKSIGRSTRPPTRTR